MVNTIHNLIQLVRKLHLFPSNFIYRTFARINITCNFGTEETADISILIKNGI